jgi:DHA1 family tetracycline resistance protein-like MFS transporter
MKQKNVHVIIILIITIIIDVLGLGIIFPIFPELFFGDASFFLHNTSNEVRQLLYGIAIGVWPLGILLGGPFWGELSDNIGRKMTIIICLAANIIIHLITALSILINNYYLFIICRFFCGYVGGSFEIAQAAVTDISTKEQKVRNLGWMNMAASLGFILGPTISVFLNNYQICPIQFKREMPFIIAACLTLINIISIIFIFKEKNIFLKKTLSINPLKSITLFLYIFKDSKLAIYAILLFLLQLGWGFYVQNIPLILNIYFNLSIPDIGMFFTIMGISIFSGAWIIQPYVLKKITMEKAYFFSGLILSLCLFLSIIITKIEYQYYLMIISAIAELIGYSAIIITLSNIVSDKEQGKVMGSAGSIFGCAWLINACLIAPMNIIWIFLPVLISSIIVLIGCIIVYYYLQYKKNNLLF